MRATVGVVVHLQEIPLLTRCSKTNNRIICWVWDYLLKISNKWVHWLPIWAAHRIKVCKIISLHLHHVCLWLIWFQKLMLLKGNKRLSFWSRCATRTSRALTWCRDRAVSCSRESPSLTRSTLSYSRKLPHKLNCWKRRSKKSRITGHSMISHTIKYQLPGKAYNLWLTIELKISKITTTIVVAISLICVVIAFVATTTKEVPVMLITTMILVMTRATIRAAQTLTNTTIMVISNTTTITIRCKTSIVVCSRIATILTMVVAHPQTKTK